MCESIYLPMRNQSQLKGPTRLSRYCFYLEGAVVVTSNGDITITTPSK